MRTVTLAALLAGTLGHSAIADETAGVILAYDRLANILVIRDRAVWSLGAEVMVLAYLESGDRVRLTYASAGGDGLTQIDGIERVEG